MAAQVQLCESMLSMLAGKRATAMSLRALFDFAKNDTLSHKARKIAMAQFLHRELPIRMAQRIEELSRLPFGLSDSDDVQWITSTYSAHVERLVATARPETSQDEELFANAVSEVLVNRVAVPRRLSRAARLAEEAFIHDDEFRPSVDDAMERFFVARIGLRLLVEHYLSARAVDGQGEIDAFCRPGSIAREAAETARKLCF